MCRACLFSKSALERTLRWTLGATREIVLADKGGTVAGDHWTLHRPHRRARKIRTTSISTNCLKMLKIYQQLCHFLKHTLHKWVPSASDFVLICFTVQNQSGFVCHCSGYFAFLLPNGIVEFQGRGMPGCPWQVHGKSMGLVVTLDNRSLLPLVSGHWPLDTVPPTLRKQKLSIP